MAELRFTQPIAPPVVTKCRIREARRINDTTKYAALEIEFQTDGAAILDNTIELVIDADRCTKVTVKPEEERLGVTDLFKTETVTIPMAFEQVLGAWFTSGGNTGVLAKLQELELLPAGAAS
jgi:hypothetical protein